MIYLCISPLFISLTIMSPYNVISFSLIRLASAETQFTTTILRYIFLLSEACVVKLIGAQTNTVSELVSAASCQSYIVLGEKLTVKK